MTQLCMLCFSAGSPNCHQHTLYILCPLPTLGKSPCEWGLQSSQLNNSKFRLFDVLQCQEITHVFIISIKSLGLTAWNHTGQPPWHPEHDLNKVGIYHKDGFDVLNATQISPVSVIHS